MKLAAMEHFSGHDIPENSRFGTFLNTACVEGDLYFVEDFFKRAFKENIAVYLNHRCYTGTPQYSASFGNHPAVIEALLEAGASLDLVGGEMGSPLHAACATGRMDATKLLLKRGAKLDCMRDDGTVVSAMEAARGFGNIQALLQRFQDEGIEGLEMFAEEEWGRSQGVRMVRAGVEEK